MKKRVWYGYVCSVAVFFVMITYFMDLSGVGGNEAASVECRSGGAYQERRYNMSNYRAAWPMRRVADADAWRTAVREACLSPQERDRDFRANVTYELFEAFLQSSTVSDMETWKAVIMQSARVPSGVARFGNQERLVERAYNNHLTPLKRVAARCMLKAVAEADNEEAFCQARTACEEKMHTTLVGVLAGLGVPCQMERMFATWLFTLARRGLIEHWGESLYETQKRLRGMLPPGRRTIEAELAKLPDDHVDRRKNTFGRPVVLLPGIDFPKASMAV